MIYLPGSTEIVSYVMNLRRMLEKDFGMNVKDVSIEFQNGNLIYIFVLEEGSSRTPEIKNLAFVW
jgi:hypothetical protein